MYYYETLGYFYFSYFCFPRYLKVTLSRTGVYLLTAKLICLHYRLYSSVPHHVLENQLTVH